MNSKIRLSTHPRECRTEYEDHQEILNQIAPYIPGINVPAEGQAAGPDLDAMLLADTYVANHERGLLLRVQACLAQWQQQPWCVGCCHCVLRVAYSTVQVCSPAASIPG